MFTSRAEFRLTLRADNADERLTPLGMKLGIVSSERASRFADMQARIKAARSLATSIILTPDEAARHGLTVNRDGVRRTAYELLSRPGVDMALLASIDSRFAALDPKTAEALETEAKYAVYLDRQRADVEQLRLEEARLIPASLGFSSVPGLSNEIRQKMRERRPRSVAEAQRMEGMTPAALAIIVAHIRNSEQRKGAA